MVISRMAFSFTQLSVGLYLNSYPVRKVEFLELLLYFFRKVNNEAGIVFHLIRDCATAHSSKQNQARAITLNVYKVIRILSLPVGEVQSYFTSAEILQDKTDFDLRKLLLDKQFFSFAT